MNFNICAGMRVLYKLNNQWNVGTLEESAFHELNSRGLFLRVIPKDNSEITHSVEINDIFFDSFKLDDWVKDYPEYFMTKEDYIKFIESDNFDKHLENACVSDGEYGYYPVSKYSHQWLEKQPFDYIVRGN